MKSSFYLIAVDSFSAIFALSNSSCNDQQKKYPCESDADSLYDGFTGKRFKSSGTSKVIAATV
jgi:hypothetical protein